MVSVGDYMKNKSKKVLVFLLCVVFAINTHAAIVSDNDGSAFVSKAEFEGLKKDFSDQIDKYNSSIDGKIDGAIASYLDGISVAKKIKLDIIYDKYTTVPGNKDNGVLWCSNNNVTLCGDSNQTLAYNYTHIQSYGSYAPTSTSTAYTGKGGYWVKTLDSETNGRAKKRFRVNKNGRVDSRYLCKFTVSGTMAGFVAIDRNSCSGSWYTHDALNAINSRDSKTYISTMGENTTGNHWFTCSTFTYFEVYDPTNENIALFPLSETETEYVVDMSKTTPSISNASEDGSTRPNLVTYSETLFTISNMHQMGTFNKFTENGNSRDAIIAKINNIFTKKKLADLSFQDFYDIDKANSNIRKGLVIAEANERGEIKVKGKASANGYLILYTAAEGSDTWKDQRTSVTDISSWKTTYNSVTANVQFERTLKDVAKDDKVFMLYLPSNTSTYATIGFDSIMLTTE